MQNQNGKENLPKANEQVAAGKRKKSKQPKKIGVLDVETDPFKWGRIPRPFAAAFYDGEIYREYWGDDCIYLLCQFIADLDDDYIIYAHNGGKFDFFYLIEQGAIENPLRIINGRIVKAAMGRHELRDSYAILPIPLAAYQKDEIDYAWFEEGERDKHRSDILYYLSKDCEYLLEIVSKFIARFGLNLTIGSTAIKELEKLHPFQKQRQNHDEKYRPYYFGGRVQCFKHGVIQGNHKIFDVNSMYPDVMRNYKHPIGDTYLVKTKCRPTDINAKGEYIEFPNKPYFIHFYGINRGAIPIRTKQGLDFSQKEGEFYACSHEVKVAIKYGLLEIKQIYEVRIPFKTISFVDYVDTYIVEKIEAKQTGDKPSAIFAKLLLNSAYGKFGQNPDNYFDYIIRYVDDPLPGSDYDMYLDYGGVEIWRKPSPSHNYFDVAVAASVTSAARSKLLEALQNAINPLYCDTDSIICEDLLNVVKSDTELGAWKLEGEGDEISIAGKKLYALTQNGEPVKIASKGVKISATEIKKIALGGVYHYQHDAPNFKLSGAVNFTSRRVRSTQANLMPENN